MFKSPRMTGESIKNLHTSGISFAPKFNDYQLMIINLRKQILKDSV